MSSIFFLSLVAGTSAMAQPAEEEPAHVANPTVTLTLADPSPVIGVTGETELRIEVSDPPESPMPVPRVLCSAGQIEDLGRDGPTTFTARYVLPSSRYPQPAILVADFGGSGGPLRGFFPVRLRAAATPSLRTDPGASVTLHVGDRDFGPQVAPADGVVNVPVVVPPGVEFATARSVNQHGMATEQVLDLRVPYSQRLLFVPPESLAAGSVAEIAVYAVEPSGYPANAATVVMRAPGGKVQPLGSHGTGEARFLVRAPTVLREKTLRIEAQLKGQSTTRIATLVPLVPGRATGLALEPEAPRLARDGRTAVRVFVAAEDAYGNPVEARRADVLVDGQPARVVSSERGKPMVVVSAAPGTKRSEVVVEGVLDASYAIRRIPIGTRRAPTSPWPPDDFSPRYTLTPRLGFLWNLGTETGAALLVDATAYPSTRHPDFGMGLSLGIIESYFVAESRGGITRTSLTTLPLLFALHGRMAVGRGFLALGAGAGFALAIGRMHSYGAAVTGAGYGAAASAGIEAGFRLGRAQLVLFLQYLAVYLGELSSGDRIPGNAAGAVVGVGYRFGW
ncbi:MAG: hypothetical protein JXP73_03345 [Deltaproteobacteria bacterium]|nr:hypothetical protein [Deltaproteobacteria bacterium]